MRFLLKRDALTGKIFWTMEIPFEWAKGLQRLSCWYLLEGGSLVLDGMSR